MSPPSATTLPSLAFSAKALRTREQPISFLIAEALRNPRLINLAAGLVDPYTLPVDECLKITQTIFSDVHRGRRALQYDTTAGLVDLRTQCLAHIEQMERQPAANLGFSADDIVVTTGSQQALYLMGDVLIDPGDIVIAANPSYFVYSGTLQSLGAKVMAVPMDDDGMDVDAVGRVLEKLDRQGQIHRVKLVYCTSYFQNPTGLTLSAERRPKLLELVKKYSRKHRILLLEDAAYRELSYDGDAPRSIKSYDADNLYTAISHTFSKPFAPGIKLGYTVMPKDLSHAVVQQKGNHDFGSANLCQHIAAEALANGSYGHHVQVLRDAYRLKRDRILGALERAFGEGRGSGVVESSGNGVETEGRIPTASLRHPTTPPPLYWTHPGGGLYTWLTLPESADTSRGGAMFRNAIDTGVLYVPGDYCFQPDEHGFVPRNHLRLSFGQVHPDLIEPGIERLAAVVRGELDRTHAASASVATVQTTNAGVA